MGKKWDLFEFSFVILGNVMFISMFIDHLYFSFGSSSLHGLPGFLLASLRPLKFKYVF